MFVCVVLITGLFIPISNCKNSQSRSRPLVLVLLFLAAVCLSTVLELATRSLFKLGPFDSLLHQLFSFPLSMTCVVWLVARSGRTGWSTWMFPLIPFVAFFLIALLVSNNSYTFYYQWTSNKTALFSFVLLAFLCRASTLHLRPVEADSLPKRLTVFSILVLTTIVAIILSIDVLIRGTEFGSKRLNLLSNMRSFFQHFSTALLWFSTAWIFVTNNPKRWIGAVGLVSYMTIMGIYLHVIVPSLLRQQDLPSGMSVASMGRLLWGTFAINAFHIAIVFLCVGAMHLAGYRWDVRRRLPAGVEEKVAERG